MQGRSQSQDELARRRAERERLRKETDGAQQGEEEEELPKFTWSDTFAMIIAAYQVLLPMLLAMVGVMVAAYFLFQFIFS